MADNKNEQHDKEDPVIRDKRRIDPDTGDVREPTVEAEAEASASTDGADDAVDPSAQSDSDSEQLSDADQALLAEAEKNLVADMQSEVKRAQAELYNFRQRVERDRVTNREAVVAEVIRSLLPALDDLARAEAHGDLVDGAPLTLVAQKLRGTFEKYGLRQVGEKGEAFDPAFHEAVVQLPSADATENTIADVIEPGYMLGDRLVRPAKVAVSVPAE